MGLRPTNTDDDDVYSSEDVARPSQAGSAKWPAAAIRPAHGERVDSLFFALLGSPTRPVLDIKVDDEVQLLFREAVVACKRPYGA